MENIREATEEDIPKIIELGLRFLKEGPYAPYLTTDPIKLNDIAKRLITHPEAKVLVAEDTSVIGVLAIMVQEHYFSGEPFACEVIWYVEPEHRVGGIGLRMLFEAERMAKGLGCKQMSLTAPALSEEIKKLYTRCGYKPVETIFQRTF